MTDFEKTLRVLRVQACFEVAEAGACAAKASAELAVADAADQRAAVDRQAVSEELRRQTALPSLNPTLLSCLRDSRRQAAALALEARRHAAQCREREEQCSSGLAAQRHREKSLGRLLEAESRRRLAACEERQAVERGDAWLRSHWRGSR